MPSGIDAALKGLENRGFDPSAKPKVKAEVKKSSTIAASTIDLRAEGLDACKQRVADMEKRIDAQQKKIAELPPTKGNKPKIAELKKALEELQRDPDYRGALTIVREKEDEERERRRGERERAEEEALSLGISKKAPEVSNGVKKVATKAPDAGASAAAALAAADDGTFELDSEVVAVVNSAVEGSADAQEKLRSGPGQIQFKTNVREEVGTMAKAAVDKFGMSLKRAGLREGALRTVWALLWNQPAVLPVLPTIIGLLEETNLKSEPGNKATDLAGNMCRAGPNGKAMPELVFPTLLAHCGAASGGKWKIKVACLALVKDAMLRMRSHESCPLQLGVLMPQVTTMLRSAVGDARKEVKKAAEDLLGHIGRDMVETPEIKELVEELCGSIVDSANMQRASEALQRLSNTTFMNTVDAASFSLLFPIVSRAMREREHDAKKKGVQVVGASVTLIASPELLTPYLPELMPLLQECLLHPADDVQREAAKTFGQLAANLPKLADEDIMPFLLEQLESRDVNADVSEVNRRGAAHGLCEVLLKRPDMLQDCLYNTIVPRIVGGETPERKAGALALFQFLPHLGTAQFLPHVVRCIPALLGALEVDSEVVTKQAKRAIEVCVEEYGPTYPRLLLPHMQDALFVAGEDAQDSTVQLFFFLCDKIQEAVKFGQDFLSVGCLTTAQRHSLLSSIYIARTDENHNVRRNATLLWKDRVQSGPKAKAEILPALLGYLKGLLDSDKPRRQASAKACIADLQSAGDVSDVTLPGVAPLHFLAQVDDTLVGVGADQEEPKEAPPQSRSDILRTRLCELLPAVPLAPPVRPYVEAVVRSCCIEARNRADAEQSLEAELMPMTPPKAQGAIKHFGLEAILEKAFDGVHDLKGPVSEERSSGDALVRVDNLMLMYGGGHTLLKNTTLNLLKGHRYGVVGRNGAGKTTLMSTLASGKVQQIPKWLKTLYVKPEILMEVSDLTAVQFCQRQGVVHGESTSFESLTAALSEVGFPEDMQAKAVSELSGGWRMKLLIAAAMMRDCDLLLLDEPTNHLDKASVEWLTSYLRSLTKSTVMVISHDPSFLNNVCTDIIQYSKDRTLEYYEGNFESFRDARNITSEEEAEALLLGQDTEDFKLEEAAAPGGEAAASLGLKSGLLDKASKISFPIPGKLQGHSTAKPVLELKNVYFSYDDEGEELTYQLSDVSCKVGLSSRIGIVGQNGAGKTTLLKVLVGEMPASKGPNGATPGEVVKHRNLRMAYISQDHMFHLEDFTASSPYVYIQKRYQNGWDEALQQRLTMPANEEEAKLRKELGAKFGKYGREVKTIVGRTVRGNETLYEVEWMGLEDPKQNTHETIGKLRKLSVAGMARAYDERLAAQAAGIDQRPLSAKEIVKHFEQFGLDEELVMNRQIGTFSAGQRSKLTLGASFWTKPHLVALDEPTNYIDMETLDSLAKGLNRFKGAVIVISHSGEFVERVCEEKWLVDDKHVTKQVTKK